jgi:uncharacterized protein (TIGR02996 family)
MTTLTATLGQIRRNILEEPDADDLRMIYADALEDDGQLVEAEFVRASMRLANEVHHRCYADDGHGKICNLCAWCDDWKTICAAVHPWSAA